MTHIYNGQLDAFDLYHQVHDSYYSRPSTSILGGPALPALGHALAGSTGAAISNISTYPLALIITRLQIQKELRGSTSPDGSRDYKSIRDAARKIYHQGGPQALYTGLIYDTYKTIADSFLFFLAYNFLRQQRIESRQHRSSRLPIFDELGVGFLAGAFSKLLTTPIANIVTRKQASSMTINHSPKPEAEACSIRSIAFQIHSEKGMQGFWSGYSASLVLTLNPSLTFFFFETLKRAIIPRDQRSSPPPQFTFLLAAVSKAMASAITYPFSLAKSRTQVSSSRKKENGASGSDKIPSSNSAASSARIEGPGNVFSVVLDIARVEGLRALYNGLSGEVMKGFFSHGITMITKDLVHKGIIRLYYAVSRLLRRYPHPENMRHRATDKTVHISNITTHSGRDGVEMTNTNVPNSAAVDQNVAAKHNFE